MAHHIKVRIHIYRHKSTQGPPEAIRIPPNQRPDIIEYEPPSFGGCFLNGLYLNGIFSGVL